MHKLTHMFPYVSYSVTSVAQYALNLRLIYETYNVNVIVFKTLFILFSHSHHIVR